MVAGLALRVGEIRESRTCADVVVSGGRKRRQMFGCISVNHPEASTACRSLQNTRLHSASVPPGTGQIRQNIIHNKPHISPLKSQPGHVVLGIGIKCWRIVIKVAYYVLFLSFLV